MREQIRHSGIKTLGLFEASHCLVESFIGQTEKLYKVAVVQATLIVSGSVHEAERNLFALILFPVTFGMKPRIGQRLIGGTESGDWVIGCGVVHFKATHNNLAFLPCAVESTLGRCHVGSTESAICGVHKVAPAAVIGV